MPSSMSNPLRRLAGGQVAWRSWTVVAALPVALACQGDHLTREPVLAEPEKLYWDLRLNHHAVTMSTTAPYDTLTLAAIPRSHSGALLTGLPVPHYQSLDPDLVFVTPAGVLIAIAPTAPNQLVRVIATLTDGNLQHADTVFVKVIDDPAPPRLASFSIHPLPPDSAKMAVNLGGAYGPKMLSPRIIDSAGGVMADIPVAYWSSDPVVAEVLSLGDPDFIAGFIPVGAIRGKVLGTVTFYASTTAFGITKTDTLPYRIGYPVYQQVTAYYRLVPPLGDTVPAIGTISPIGVGGMIEFDNQFFHETDFTFADADVANIAAGNTFAEFNTLPPLGGFGGFLTYPQYCLIYHVDCDGTGNIVMPAGGSTAGTSVPRALRVFRAPGTYEYHASGISGRIVVVDES